MLLETFGLAHDHDGTENDRDPILTKYGNDDQAKILASMSVKRRFCTSLTFDPNES